MSVKEENKSEEKQSGESKITKRLLKGMRVRDEFVCPITFEIMMDAVVASDGHSYERSAITKWMNAKDNSPRTGEPLENKILVPNLNLKRVIQDMIAEGGAGLYTRDVSDQGRMIELTPQKLLVMLCLGPPESDWNLRNFQVSPDGCLGGRKMPENANKEFIVFKDTTVSRRHFEINYDSSRSIYALRDLGSAGGSFVRISYGAKKILHPGMILLMGKHQFTVSSVDTNAPKSIPTVTEAMKTLVAGDEKFSFHANPGGTAALAELVDETEVFVDLLLEQAAGEDAAKEVDKSNLIRQKLSSLRSNLMMKSSANLANNVAESKDSGKVGTGESKAGSKQSDGLQKSGSHSLTLTCFAPDASPMQGQSFHVGVEGATVGRRSQCTICMCIKGSENPKFVAEVDKDGGEKILNIDSAVSTEHARINLDTETGEFYILDGSPSKPSTNGTWYRLSGPHQESPYHDLTANMEVLLGTVRFQVGEAETITERHVFSDT